MLSAMSHKADQFYVSLPSNNSLIYYPENTISSYTTQLPREINLNGEWEVGLSEIVVPNHFLDFEKEDAAFYCYNIHGSLPKGKERETLASFQSEVDKNEGWHQIELEDKSKYTITKVYIPHGMYKDEQELIAAISDKTDEALGSASDSILPENYKHVQIQMKHGFMAISKVCDCADFHFLEFTGKLKKVVGFEEPELLWRQPFSPPQPCVLRRAKPSLVFVYTDIIQPQITGDTFTQLLRIVTLENSQSGCEIVRTFPAPQYHRLLTNRFRTIEVLLRDDLGEALPFLSGVSAVTLHFKKRES